MNRLGNIILTHPERVTIGSIHYDAKRDNSLVGLDLAALLPVCRKTEMKELCGWCRPLIEITDVPYLLGDIQVTLKTKRIKVGWLMSSDDEHGRVVYAVRLDVETILSRWDRIFLHVHPTNKKEDG